MRSAVSTNAKRAAKAILPHPLWRLVRQRRVRREVARYAPRDHVGTFGDVRLHLRFEDGLAEGWYGQDRGPLPEIEFLKEVGVLRAGVRVFDLGAHQGVVALELAAAVTPGGAVVAVEGEPHNARLAEANRARNTVGEGVVVVHSAVTDSPGSISFAEGLNGHVDPSTRMGNATVPATTIDTLCERFGVPDVVVLDIEGHEGVALRAAERASDAAWVIEVHTGQLEPTTSAQEIVAYFDGCERWVGVGEAFALFDGFIPEERFWLIAVPPNRLRTTDA